jgi:hypothetical protein
MQFQVPQFIEHDPKILGPFTVKQSIYIGGAMGACFFLYFSLGKSNFFLYVIVCGALFASALGLAFLKVEGLGISTVSKNFFNFTVGSKIYKWDRKASPVFLPTRTSRKSVETKKEEKTKLTLRPSGKIESLSKKIFFEK